MTATLLLDVVLIVLASARLTRLAVVDQAAEPARRFTRWAGWRLAGDRGLIAADDAVACPFCVGFWVALLTVASYAAWAGPAWRVTAGVLAASYAAGHLVARFDDVDEYEE